MSKAQKISVLFFIGILSSFIAFFLFRSMLHSGDLILLVPFLFSFIVWALILSFRALLVASAKIRLMLAALEVLCALLAFLPDVTFGTMTPLLLLGVVIVLLIEYFSGKSFASLERSLKVPVYTELRRTFNRVITPLLLLFVAFGYFSIWVWRNTNTEFSKLLISRSLEESAPVLSNIIPGFAGDVSFDSFLSNTVSGLLAAETDSIANPVGLGVASGIEAAVEERIGVIEKDTPLSEVLFAFGRSILIGLPISVQTVLRLGFSVLVVVVIKGSIGFLSYFIAFFAWVVFRILESLGFIKSVTAVKEQVLPGL